MSPTELAARKILENAEAMKSKLSLTSEFQSELENIKFFAEKIISGSGTSSMIPTDYIESEKLRKGMMKLAVMLNSPVWNHAPGFELKKLVQNHIRELLGLKA